MGKKVYLCDCKIVKTEVMATMTLNYDARDTLINSILKSAVLAGAKIKSTSLSIKNTAKEKDFFAQSVGKQYEYLFGKKKKYTDNEVFAYNSILSANKIVADEEFFIQTVLP
ncbi:hypothetical protein FACS1894199_00960 [Bacteroidia bacterium]|nr:hypothetical protein FACS1894199_00960 [Bacteroidia bacterium]